MMADYQGFIATHLAPGRSALVPEIRLYLATELTPLWQATEAFLEQHNIAPPYWAFAWPGSEALARYVTDHPGLVRGRRVLDFAAGGGLAGIAAARAGAAHVAAAEIDPAAVAAISLNAGLNRVEIAARAGDVVGEEGDWEVLIAGDICYEAGMSARIIPWLRRQARRSIVLLADPGRKYIPAAPGEKLAEYQVPTSLELEDRRERIVAIYRVAA
ncbi:50S ribosomal protein L11 methyltransferase [Acidocella sp.]|uniref:class I SAM-dependent methyltransferase n=1 Tax=Acidocella sp. TaxID=50710 RepID=UPI003439CEDB